MKFLAMITSGGGGKKVLDTEFKVVDIKLNLLFISDDDIHSMKKKYDSNDYLKIFAKEEDAAYYDTFIPFNKVQIAGKLRKEKDEFMSRGQLLDAAK
jgi:hypothetical protein